MEFKITLSQIILYTLKTIFSNIKLLFTSGVTFEKSLINYLFVTLLIISLFKCTATIKCTLLAYHKPK